MLPHHGLRCICFLGRHSLLSVALTSSWKDGPWPRHLRQSAPVRFANVQVIGRPYNLVLSPGGRWITIYDCFRTTNFFTYLFTSVSLSAWRRRHFSIRLLCHQPGVHHLNLFPRLICDCHGMQSPLK